MLPAAGSTSTRMSLHPGKRRHKRAFAEQRHGQTRAGAQLYRCTAVGCTKSFARKDYLQDHLQTHAGHKRNARDNEDGQKPKNKLRVSYLEDGIIV